MTKSMPPHPNALLCEILHLQQTSLPADAAQGSVLGWDSMSHIGFMLALERHYGISINKESVLACRTLQGACAYLESQQCELPDDS